MALSTINPSKPYWKKLEEHLSNENASMQRDAQDEVRADKI
jgi:hypothetical protein